MSINHPSSFNVLLLGLGVSFFAVAGCKHTPPKNTTPISQPQAPATKTIPRVDVDPREKELQGQIDLMQEQIKILAPRTEALGSFHGTRMGPKWIEKVQAARADASRPSERVRFLEATKTLLARRLGALRTEMKVYEDYQASDPAIPRPQ
jgi:hypothetical protein